MPWELHQLWDKSQPDLYRRNAFRLLGLSVHATGRDIRNQSTKLQKIAKFGALPQRDEWLLAIDISLTEEDLREIEQNLGDPENRILEEFFWFWPMPGRDVPPTMQDVEMWKQYEHDPALGGIAIHNLAIFFHAQALDLETLSTQQPLGEKRELQRSVWWDKAFYHWSSLLHRDDFWVEFSERIRTIDDPRLTTGLGRRLRQGLPTSLLRINAQLAIRAFLDGQKENAQRHLELLRANWFTEEAVQESAHLSLKPLLHRLRDLCKKAELQATATPRQGDQFVADLLAETGPLLTLMDTLLPGENESAKTAAHDEVATSANTSLRQFGNVTRNWKKVAALLAQIRNVARSESLISKIDQDIASVTDLASTPDYWCAEGYFDLPDPLLQSLEDAREYAEAENLDKAIKILLSLLTHKGKILSAELEGYVTKPLAFCLNHRSAAGFRELIERFGQPLAVVARIRGWMDARKSGSGVSYYAQTDNPLSGGHKCASCARELQKAWATIAIPEGRFTICPDCNNKLNLERDARRYELSNEIKSIAIDLLMACRLDPQNKQCAENLGVLSQMAKTAEVDLPPTILAEIHFGLAKTEDLVRAATSYTGKPSRIIRDTLRQQDQAAYQQLELTEQKERHKKLVRRSIVVGIGLIVLIIGIRFIYLFSLSLSNSPSAIWQTYERGARDRAATLNLLASNFGGVSREERKEITNYLITLQATQTEIKPLLAFLTSENIEIRRDAWAYIQNQSLDKNLLRYDLAALLGYGSEEAQKEIVEYLQTIAPDWITSDDATPTLNRLWVQMGSANPRQAGLALLAMGRENLERNGYNAKAISDAINNVLGGNGSTASPIPSPNKTARRSQPEPTVVDSSSLKTQIQQNRERLQQLEQELGQIENEVKASKRTIDDLASQLRRAKRASGAGEPSDRDGFNDAVDQYNQYVRQHNQTLQSYRQKQNEYQQLLQKTNQMIRQYNGSLTR